MASASVQASSVRAQASQTAVWVETFVSATLGPRGAHKLVDTGDPVLVDSGAEALREVPRGDAGLAPYQELAGALSAACGDGGSLSVFLVARLVRTGPEAPVSVTAVLEGFRLARRQALAQIGAMAEIDDGSCLDQVAPTLAGFAPTLLAGLREMGADHGGLDLDDIDIRAEPRTDPQWGEGVLLEPTHGPTNDGSNVGVLLVQDGRRTGTQNASSYRVEDPGSVSGFHDGEGAGAAQELDAIQGLGVGLVACQKKLEEGLAHALARDGVWVVENVPSDAMARLALATGARQVINAAHATVDDIGRADVVHRPVRRGGVWVQGPGPSGTILVPGQTAAQILAQQRAAERLLRATGLFLQDPRAVPGGGRWQRDAAAGLRAAAGAAPGKTAFGIHLVADAFDAAADGMVSNAGHNPLVMDLLPDAGQVRDAWPIVKASVTAAFEAAEQILRIDGRYQKRPSNAETMRGGPGPIGSPKGMPGDVPPLM